MAIHSTDHMNRPSAVGPLFIVGNARSGSTLLRHMLNNSPRIAIAPESHFMRRARRLHLAERLAGSPTASDVVGVVDALYALDDASRTGYWPWLRRHVSARVFAERFQRGDRSLAALFGLLMAYFAEQVRAPEQLQLIGEKSPEHLNDVPQLAAWYPNSIFVHTLRDPRAIFASELRRRREGRWGPMRMRGPIPGRLMHFGLLPLQLVHTTLAWRRAVKLDAVYRESLGARYLLIRYEQLVREPRATLGRVCAAVGIPFDPAMLAVDTIGSSFSDQRHAGAGLDPTAIDRWRQHVGRLPRTWFSLTLGREMARLGYR